MKINYRVLPQRLGRSIKGLINAFDSPLDRWWSEEEDDIFTNYVTIWALSRFQLATIKQAQIAAQWISDQQDIRSSLWKDSTGSKPIEMTNRALIALILTKSCNSYEDIKVHVNWILTRQKEHGGAWIEETKHMGGKTAYGPTLPATFLLRLIRDELKPVDARIGAGLNKVRDWLINHYKRKTIWNFEHRPGEKDPLAVAWALRIYANCTDEPHQLQKDGIAILRKFLRNGEKTWTFDKYMRLYNCLHSFALCGIGLEDEDAASLAEWLMKRYDGYDFDNLTTDSEGVRKLCGMLITVSRALELSEEGGYVLRKVPEWVT